MLSSCLATFDCRVESVAAATHSIFIGKVEAIVLEPDLDPLVYVEGDYGLIAPRSARRTEAGCGRFAVFTCRAGSKNQKPQVEANSVAIVILLSRLRSVARASAGRRPWSTACRSRSPDQSRFATPDDRYLSDMWPRRIFRAGLKYSLVDGKWPAFEEVFMLRAQARGGDER